VTGTDTSLVGRREELSRLRELVAPPYKQSRVLVVMGDPGVGKTVLLAEAAREARSAGVRVLAAAGRESEQDLAFAGLERERRLGLSEPFACRRGGGAPPATMAPR
jgi:DNA replication protein DnaC